jgi:hypothetical protein
MKGMASLRDKRPLKFNQQKSSGSFLLSDKSRKFVQIGFKSSYHRSPRMPADIILTERKSNASPHAISNDNSN